MTTTHTSQHSKKPFYLGMIAILSASLIYWFGSPISFGYDAHNERCLQDVRFSLLIHHSPSSIHDGDMVFFTPPPGILTFVKEDYVMKIVGGVAGDHLVIKNGNISINNKIIASGFPLAEQFYHHKQNYFDKDEIIPKNKVFMMTTHPLSDDSRYWGYLDTKYIHGTGYKIY